MAGYDFVCHLWVVCSAIVGLNVRKKYGKQLVTFRFLVQLISNIDEYGHGGKSRNPESVADRIYGIKHPNLAGAFLNPRWSM